MKLICEDPFVLIILLKSEAILHKKLKISTHLTNVDIFKVNHCIPFHFVQIGLKHLFFKTRFLFFWTQHPFLFMICNFY